MIAEPNERTGPDAVLGRRRLKVEMVLPALDVGGMEMMTARLTRALTHRGHDVGVTCIVAEGALAHELRSNGYRVTVVRAPGLLTNFRAPRLEGWLRELKPDLVHAHSGAWLKAARAARRAAVPYVISTEHGLLAPEPWYGGALRRRAARYTDSVVAVSDSMREFLVQRAKLDSGMVQVIPNGVDVDRFVPGPRAAELRRQLAIPEGRVVIGTVGRLAPVKNHEMLLDAFAKLYARRPDAALVIIGEGPCRPALEARISRLGLTGHAFLGGARTDVASVYREFDLFVLSSKDEAMPMSLLEAMASGVPTIATRVGGIPDVLEDGRYGWLIPPEDPVALAEAMATALEDVDQHRSVAVRARRHVIACYSEDAMLESYERLYYSHTAPDAESNERVLATQGI